MSAADPACGADQEAVRLRAYYLWVADSSRSQDENWHLAERIETGLAAEVEIDAATASPTPSTSIGESIGGTLVSNTTVVSPTPTQVTTGALSATLVPTSPLAAAAQ